MLVEFQRKAGFLQSRIATELDSALRFDDTIGMGSSTGTVERAFELAAQCNDLTELKRLLKKEGHFNVEAHFEGASIKADLRKLFRSAE